MTRSVGGAPPAGAAVLHPPERPKQLSVPLDEARHTLASDVVFLADDSVLWAQRWDKRRRVFQKLLNKYYRQIRHGCSNPHCETPTCLSCRKRLAEGPFRQFTALSARTLACFLASQEHPERGLCPHMHEKAREAFQSKSPRNTAKGPQDSHKGEASARKSRQSAQNGCSASPGRKLRDEREDEIVAGSSRQHTASMPVSAHQSEQRSEESKVESDKPKKILPLKDPKSFSQNLFDTAAIKLLQLMKYQNGRFPWDPATGLGDPLPSEGLTTASQDAPVHDEVQINVAHNDGSLAGRSDIPRDDPDASNSLAKETPLIRHQDVTRSIRDLSLLQTPEDIIHEPDSITGEVTSDTPRHNIRPEHGLNKARKLPSNGTAYVGTNGETHPKVRTEKNELWSSQQYHADSEQREGGQNDTVHGTENPMSDLRGEKIEPHGAISLDVESPTIGSKCRPTTAGLGLNYLHPFAVLSHFSPENIQALVTVVECTDTETTEQKHLVRNLGRTCPPFCYAALLTDHSEELRATYAFGIQSIVYVLTTPQALLASFKQCFRGEPSKQVEHAQNSIDQAEMTRAFRRLRQIDHHPQNILPSLWVVLDSVFASDQYLMKSSGPKSRRSPEDGTAISTKHDKEAPPKSKVVGDLEAAHIIKVALTALVASVPCCSLNTWLAAVKLRSSGHVAPEIDFLQDDSQATRPLLGVMDAYEDEMALSLMTKLVRAFASRRCWSELAKARENFDVMVVTRNLTTPDFIELIIPYLKIRNPGLDTCELRDTSRWYQIFNQLSGDALGPGQGWAFSAMVLEWLRSVLLKEWDGKAEVLKWGPVGGAIDFMSCLYQQHLELGLTPEDFHTPFLSERLDAMDMPVEWLNSQPNRKTIHILSHPFLFTPATLVMYFRAMNHAAMFKAFESSMTAARLCMQMSQIAGRGESRLFARLRTAMTNYLVLEIRRDNVLTGALNQLWRRERRELMRPLKVRMGMDEGEEGVDHGGVQQEFFRIAMSEALKPEYGLFTTDSRTNMSWFQPCSLEPLYKFELIGLLTSLAIYNGLTLPFTFPLAFYRKLLGLPVTSLSHIQDGWPDLAKGLAELLCWADGDVADVFVRSYVFSIETISTVHYVDMERVSRDNPWPPTNVQKCKSNLKGKTASFEPDHIRKAPTSFDSPAIQSPQSSADGSDGWLALGRSDTPPTDLDSAPNEKANDDEQYSGLRSRNSSITSEASMVTNANRDQYVTDYIFWLSDKSIRPEFEAFARGFFVCLDKKALSIFTPEALQTVVEGFQDIDVDQLEQTARYENGYTTDHRIIEDFWEVIRQFSMIQVRRLLEFVTASDRIPVNGIRSILFVIQRNGTDDERLPTSLTCFGRLLLPEYSSKEILKERIEVAIENSQGFGVA